MANVPSDSLACCSSSPTVKRTYSRKTPQMLSGEAEPRIPSSLAGSRPQQAKKCKITDYFPVSSVLPNTDGVCNVSSNENSSVFSIKTDPITSTSSKPRAKFSRQLFLDLGQQMSSICKECGMRYTHGLAQDESLHVRFHAYYVKGIVFAVKKFNNVYKVAKTIAGHSIHVIWRPEFKSQALLREVYSLTQLINTELEAAEQCKDEIAKLLILACVAEDGRVIGMCSVEQISTAYIAKMDDEGNVTLDAQVPARMGVNRVWVRHTHRRQGIAVRLVASSRRHLLSPPRVDCVIGKSEIAFSQPTRDGFAFASSYRGDGRTCLVYLSAQTHAGC